MRENMHVFSWKIGYYLADGLLFLSLEQQKYLMRCGLGVSYMLCSIFS